MSGRFASARRWVAYGLILLFTAIPYIFVHGKPIVLLDLTTRHFRILGIDFLPTDTLLLALFLVGTFLAIFLLTAFFGRVWCGWGCPQTVYMEFVFRPIERLFEGTPGRVSKSSFVRGGAGKVLKYAVYLAISMYLAHTFLAYFVGVEQLRHWVTSSPFQHPVAFAVMAAVTAAMMFDFAYFREQTCIVACPYGRFQSALLDRNSLIVTYDRKRGEPRGKGKRANTSKPDVSLRVMPSTPAAAGDCVDCSLCVQVCPTGIDIREGLQMECIGCAQCIDACDDVMAKLKRPLGLIRYSSESAMAGEKRRLLRPRTVIYPVLLAAVATAFLVLLVSRAPADVTVLRGLGKPFTEMPEDRIGNQVRIKIVNRTDATADYAVSVADPEVKIEAETSPIRIEPGHMATVPAMISVPRSAFSGGKNNVSLTVDDGHGFHKALVYTLMGPGSMHHDEDTDATRAEHRTPEHEDSEKEHR